MYNKLQTTLKEQSKQVGDKRMTGTTGEEKNGDKSLEEKKEDRQKTPSP